ncbi:RNA exonuclease ngl2 [Nowakowskiella sp. JEL0078]|nr:RNA exonuclease ngl2 [Nowakowskiella sp. JEL0078]
MPEYSRSFLELKIPDKGFRFTVLSYNILAQCLVRRTLYPHSSKEALKGKIRIPRVLNEILTLEPDIACLQELDCFESDFVEKISAAGYDYVYHKKNPEKIDTGHGLGIFWKKDKFEKYEYFPFFFDKSELTNPTTLSPETGNICQILGLKIIGSNDIPGIIISNQHLYWRIQANYERVRQMYVSIEETLKIRKKILATSGTEWPIVICGDLNTCPNDALYWLITKKELTSELLEQMKPKNWVHVSKSVPPNPTIQAEKDPENPVNLVSASLLLESFKSYPKFKSSYANYRDHDHSHTINPDWFNAEGICEEHWAGEPSYTNFGIWKGTLDYIFYSNDFPGVNCSVVKLLEIPKEDVLKPAIPNNIFPSDHISVMTELEFSKI